MPSSTPWAPYALAAARIVTALLFIEHATMKFLSFPAPVPGVSYPLPALLVAAGLVELAAGILVAAGLFTRVAAFVASGEMAAAYFMAHAPLAFWPALNMGEPAILFCFLFLCIAAVGPGTLALDSIFRPFGRPAPLSESA